MNAPPSAEEALEYGYVPEDRKHYTCEDCCADPAKWKNKNTTEAEYGWLCDECMACFIMDES